MASKLALLLLGGIVISAAGAGAALGLYVGGSGPFADAGDGAGTPATPTVTAASEGSADGPEEDGSGDAESTTGPGATPTATEGPTATPPVETVAADSFNQTRIASLVAEAVNDRRAERNLGNLRRDDELARIATSHSRRMSEQRYVSHSAGGFTTEDRYRRNGLYDQCRVPDDSNTGLRDGSDIETLDKVSAGTEFDGRLNSDERAVAVDAVENWFNRTEERRKLTNRNVGSLGIGVIVTADNRAYITADLCG